MESDTCTRSNEPSEAVERGSILEPLVLRVLSRELQQGREAEALS
jgi:hypothetical protein